MLKGGAPTKDLLEDNREGYQEKNFSTLPIMTQEEKDEMLDLIRLAIRKEVGGDGRIFQYLQKDGYPRPKNRQASLLSIE